MPVSFVFAYAHPVTQQHSNWTSIVIGLPLPSNGLASHYLPNAGLIQLVNQLPIMKEIYFISVSNFYVQTIIIPKNNN